MSDNEKIGSLDVQPAQAMRGEHQDGLRRANSIFGIFQNTKQRRFLRAFYENDDQDRIRADLATFFGPRSDLYLAFYEKMRIQDGWASGWSWPVFFGSFIWFFYRKMYIWGASLILAPIVLALLFPSLSGGAFVYFAVAAKPIYVHAALKRIKKADELGLSGAERTDYLQRAGGVSRIAGLLAGVLFAALLVLLVSGLATKHH